MFLAGLNHSTLAGIDSADSPEETGAWCSSPEGAWNIYSAQNPLTEASYESYRPSEPVSQTENLLSDIPWQSLDNYGRRERQIISSQAQPGARPASSLPRAGLSPGRLFAGCDRLRVGSSSDQPGSSGVPSSKDYRTKFHLDSLWGGFAHGSGAGAYGNLELWIQRLDGRSRHWPESGNLRKIENSNILLTYLHWKKRADYGVGIYNLFDQNYYRSFNNPEPDYYRTRQRETGLYLLVRYPFNRFWRIDLEQRLYQWEYHQDSWLWDSSWTEGEWINDTYPLDNPWEPVSSLTYSPGLSIIHDNTIYGSTGPMVGWRAYYNIRKSFAGEKHGFPSRTIWICAATIFSRRYAWANRLIAGISTGGNPQRFNLGGYYGVRAYDGDLSGEKKVMLNSELRFPFF